ncbi:hypothetical protein SK128_011969 [Halocaridina rubra]|uniref:Uncharacterized protein n=1 Tax=Halocaridina rubra TaxID=373956 RepID=A0AAN8WSB4_HALRR
MRSGQYKLSGSAGSKGTVGNDGAVAGQFRSNQMEVPLSDSPIPEFPHMNSLVVTINKMSESRPLNKSCENLSGPRSAVTRVEQRVKSFLQRGEARLRQEDLASPPQAEDGWQYGHVVTLPRRPRLSLALSHSALNHFATSDTASCLSASSGYSSSSSSSYGSFKSSASSNCSTLPRKKKSGGDEHIISPASARSCTFVDNPMYDITPGTDPRTYRITNSLKRRGSPSPGHDPIYDFTPATDPRNYNLKSHRRRSASVPRHEPVYDATQEADIQHFNKPTRRGSAPVNEPLYDLTPDSDPRLTSFRQSSPNLRNTDPIYDTIPGSGSYSSYRHSPTQSPEHLYDIARPSRLLTPDSGTHGGLDSLEESALDSLDCSEHQTEITENDDVREDLVAKECREYFEKRLKNSETLKKRWSMCSTDSGADSGDTEMSPSSASASSTEPSSSSSVISSHSSSSKEASSGSTTSSEQLEKPSSAKKTPLDQKMAFLRKEIWSDGIPPSHSWGTNGVFQKSPPTGPASASDLRRAYNLLKFCFSRLGPA